MKVPLDSPRAASKASRTKKRLNKRILLRGRACVVAVIAGGAALEK